MVGKNNHKMKYESEANKVYRYSIRKLSVGVASVAIAAGLYWTGSRVQTVQASEVVSQDKATIEEVQTFPDAVPPSEEAEVEVDLDAQAEEVTDSVEASEKSATESASVEGEAPSLEVGSDEGAVEAVAGDSAEEAPVEESHAEESAEEDPTASVVAEETVVEEADASAETASPAEETTEVSAEVTSNESVVDTTQATTEVETEADSDNSYATYLDFPALASEVLTSEDPLELVRKQLGQIYATKDVEGILSYVNLGGVNSAETLKDAILTAGVNYAQDQTQPRVFATRAVSTRAVGQNVNDRVRFSNISYEYGGPNSQPNKFEKQSADYMVVKGNFTVDDSVSAGDYFTIEYGQYARPAGTFDFIEETFEIRDNNATVATAELDPNNKRYIVTFTDYVNNHDNVKGFIEVGVQPDEKTATKHHQTYPITVSLGGEQHTENVLVGYNFETNLDRVGTIMTSPLLTNEQNGKLYFVTYLNYDQNRFMVFPDVLKVNTYTPGFVKFIDTNNKLDVQNATYRVYESRNKNQLNESMYIDESLLSQMTDVTSSFPIDRSRSDANTLAIQTGVNYMDNRLDGKTHVIVWEVPLDNPNYEGDLTYRIEGEYKFTRDANNTRVKNEYRDHGFGLGALNRHAMGSVESTPTPPDPPVEQKGSFQAHHRYETVYPDGRVTIDFVEDDNLQTGTANEYYVHEKKEKDGYKFVKLTNNINEASASDSGSWTAGFFKPGKKIEITYVYQRQAPQPEPEPRTPEVEQGTFTELHIYNYYDKDGILISSDRQNGQNVVGKAGTAYVTQQQPRDGYRLVNVTGTTGTAYSPSGNYVTGHIVANLDQSVVYTYEYRPTADQSNQYEMTVEDESYETIFQYNKNLQPGELKTTQKGRDGRVQVLYEHVDPDRVPGYTADEFVASFVDGRFVANAGGENPVTYVERNGSYWREVSRERILDSRPQIVEYNFESIIDTIENPDGGVTLVYNSGKRITIPGPKEPDRPKEPQRPIITTEKVDGGTKVTIKIYDPNLKDYVDEETFIILNGEKGDKGDPGTPGRDGRDGVDGKDGESPVAEVVDNGDGTHTITIINPDGTQTTTTVRDGADGQDGRDGVDGKDGESPVAEVVDNGDGTHTITIINPDGSQTTTTVKDGQDGEDGQDGRDGVDGKDGESPVAEVVDNGDGTHTITIINPDGSETTTTVKDGQDGKDGEDGKNGNSVVVESREDITNDAGEVVGDRITLIEVDAEGKPVVGEDGQPKRTVIEIFDGEDGADGQDGRDGVDGKDGESPIAEVVDNGDGTHTITIINPDGSETTTTVKDGQDGQDGKDGNSVVVESREDITNDAGEVVGDRITLIEVDAEGNPVADEDGEPKRTVIEIFDGEDGVDGKDGKDGKNGTGVHVNAEDAVIDGKRGTLIEFFRVDENGEIADQPYDFEFIPNGEDGKSVTVVTQRGEQDGRPGTVVIFRDRDTGEEIDREFIFDGQNGTSITAQTEPGELAGRSGVWLTITDQDGNTVDRTFIYNGLDGQSPVVSTEEVVNPATGEEVGFYVTITNPDGSVIKEFIRHGQDGKDGADGQDGKDGRDITTSLIDADGNLVLIYSDGQTEIVGRVVGKDGQAPTITTTPITNDQGVETGYLVTITSPDGKQETITIRHGRDGQSVSVSTEPGTFQGTDGVWIIVTNPATGEEIDRDFVAHGEDGRSADIKAEPIVDTEGREIGYKLTIIHPDGREEVRMINHGKDGKSIVATTERGDHDGKSGAWLIIRDRDTLQEIDREFIADGEDGQAADISSREVEGGLEITIHHPDGTSHTHLIRDGQDGQDGQSISATVEPGTFNGEMGVWVIIRDRATGQELDRDFIRDGKDGEDGQDGKSPVVTTEKVTNEEGQEIGVTVKITQPDGSVETQTIYHGRDGKDGADGKDGKSVIGRVNDDGSISIVAIDSANNSETVIATLRDGKDGRDGQDGRGITNTLIDENGNLHLIFSDGSTQNVGRVVGQDGKDGRDGKDGEAPIISIQEVVDPNTGESQGYYVIIENVDGTRDKVFIRHGRDGRSPKAEVINNGDGTHTVKITDSDGRVTETTIHDGRSPKVEVIDNGDGTHTVKITDSDGRVTETTIHDGRDGKDGRDGADGKDGQTPQIRTETGEDASGNSGRWLIITDADGNEIVREFIRDGLTPSVKVEPGKNEFGESGQWIIIYDGNGNEVSREFVRDGRDGESSTIETVPGKNADGDSGLWVIVRDGDGNELSRHFIRDGKDGIGIQKIYNEGDHLTIVYTDNSRVTVELPCCGKPEGETPEGPDNPSGETPEKPENPGGETSEEPDSPEGETPREPDNPSGETPEEPDSPEGETPEGPDSPEGETPEGPENPEGETPEEPDSPEGETPEEPDNPEGETPEEPENPGGETPEEPENPGGETPEEPDNPEGETPEEPGNPEGETPEEPGNPEGETPEEPDSPEGETPQQPDSPEGETPEEPGKPEGETPDRPNKDNLKDPEPSEPSDETPEQSGTPSETPKVPADKISVTRATGDTADQKVLTSAVLPKTGEKIQDNTAYAVAVALLLLGGGLTTYSKKKENQ